MRYVRSHTTSPTDVLTLASVCATDFLCGAVGWDDAPDGWAKPQRFGFLQRRALASCLAWHPGVFRRMAATTAGVCLRFATDAAHMALAVRLDEPSAPAGGAVSEATDLSVVVDGRSVAAQVTDELLCASLADPSTDPGNGIVALPGLGARHEVCVWLPCSRGCQIRELWVDGTYVEALPRRGRLLVLGDELAQGLGCDEPAHTWPALLADRLGLELVNQSIGGQVFQPSSILDARVDGVEQVVVALGANYARERCDLATVYADARGFFSEVSRHWPKAQVWAMVPPAGKRRAATAAPSARFAAPFVRWRLPVRRTCLSLEVWLGHTRRFCPAVCARLIHGVTSLWQIA